MRALLRTGLVALAGAGLVLGAIQVPDWHYRMAGSDTALPTAAGASGASGLRTVTNASVVCPGPETVGVKKVDPKTAVAPTTVRVAVPPADVLPAVVGAGATSGSVSGSAIGGAALTFPALTAPGTGGLVSTSNASAVLVAAKGSLAPGLVATQTTLVTAGDLRGLSSAACQAPTGDTWLVGGAGTSGRRARIIVTNPSPNAVTVDLDVFGTKGQVGAIAGRGIVVAAHRRAVVLLDAIAPKETAPVVHVTATGGLVSATMSDGLLDGTTPAGSDDVIGTAPGRHLVIPGVLAAALPGSTMVRIAATDTAAKVQLKVLTATGPAPAPVTNGVVTVAAHRAKDIDLSSLPAGADGLELTSDAPIVAGVQLQRGSATVGVKRDLAWTSAQPGIDALAGIPIGSNTAPWANTLVLTAATEDASLDVVAVAADGTETATPVTVAAGTTTTVPIVGAPVSSWVRVHSGNVTASLTTTYADPAGLMLSVTPLAQPTLEVRAVGVHPQAG